MVSGLNDDALGRGFALNGVRWSKMADTLDAKRVGGARTRMMPRKRRQGRTKTDLETARMESAPQNIYAISEKVKLLSRNTI